MQNKKIFESPKFKLIKSICPEIQSAEINYILVQKVKKEQDKKLAEFNYKYLTDNLITANILSKWNTEIPENCVICRSCDNAEHLLFKCPLTRSCWEIVEKALRINFTPKTFLKQAYPQEINKVLAYISYFTYKFWIETSNKRVKRDLASLKNFIKKNCIWQDRIENIRGNPETSRHFASISNEI